MRLKPVLVTMAALFISLESVVLGLEKIYLPASAEKVLAQLTHKSLSQTLISLRSENLELTWEDQKRTWPLSNYLVSYERRFIGKTDVRLDFDKLQSSLNALAAEIDRPAINARLELSGETGKVQEFSLPVYGRRLMIDRTSSAIAAHLVQGRLSIALVLEETAPEITADSMKKLGINTLLARGESNFDGSSTNRVKNIEVGAAKFHGVLIKPGEEFSFNNILGEVDASTGYLPELVIKNHRTVYEYGGGLCQISTTLFRAVVLAGLPITERRPHDFPVRYYSPQGFDATIYPGIVDLKFKNDTPEHLLIQSKIAGKKLFFEIYGSSDGRKIALDGPHQYDQKVNGSMKAYFVRTVTFADQTHKEERFNSSYRAVPASPLEKTPLE